MLPRPRGVPRRPPYRAAVATVLCAVALALIGPFPVAGDHGTTGLTASALVPGHLIGESAVPALALGSSPAAPRPAAATLTVDGVTPSAISLSWTASGSLTFVNYTVGLSTNGPGGPFVTQATITTASSAAFATGGLTPGATTDWRVTTNDWLAGASDSNVAEAVLPPLSALNGTFLTSTDVQLNWTNNASYGGALAFVKYDVYESAGGGSPTRISTITNPGTLSASVPGLSPGSSYLFQVSTTDCFGGCGTASPSFSVTTSNVVTLGTPLALAVSIVAARSVADVGQSDLLSCTPSGGSSPFSFEWAVDNGSYGAGPASRTETFADPGAHVVTCRVTDSTPSVATAALTVSVTADPTLNLTVNRTSADIGQPIGFHCIPGAGLAPYSVDWTFADGTDAPGFNVTHAFATNGTLGATCTVTDSTLTQVAQSIGLGISPQLATAVAVNHLAVAPGTPVDVTATATGGPGTNETYAWSYGDGSATSTSVPNAQHAFAAVGRFTVQVTVTDTNNATAVASTAVDVSAISVTIDTHPSGTAGVPSTFSATASGGGGGPYTYHWGFGDGAAADGPSVTHTYAHPGTFTSFVMVTDALGASTNATPGPITLAAPPPPPPLVSAWLIVVLGLAAAIGTAIIGESAARRAQARLYPAVAGRVPASGSSATAIGRRICRVCGTANLPVRETCEVCGASLRGPLVR